MKWLFMGLIFFPLMTFSQLPIPVSPDWLKGGEKQSGVLHSTQVGLGGNNYRLIQTNVTARSRGFKLLGLISIKSPSYVQAVSRLYAQTRIQEGRPQALANVVHETAGMNLILFSLPKIRVRADLIEFTGAASESNVAVSAPPPADTPSTTPSTSVPTGSNDSNADSLRVRLRERLSEVDR